jgi:hypothetical protein
MTMLAVVFHGQFALECGILTPAYQVALAGSYFDQNKIEQRGAVFEC